jgi:hypothetical protein
MLPIDGQMRIKVAKKSDEKILISLKETDLTIKASKSYQESFNLYLLLNV